MRSNVDVWVGSSIQRIRWLIFTPDTYRIGKATDLRPPPSDWTTLGTPAAAPQAAWQSITPVVVASSTRPTMPSSRRIIEPALHPTSVSFPPGEDLPESNDLAEIVKTFSGEGRRYQVALEMPYAERGALPGRPISGDAVIVVSAVPLHDVGGGSRGAQLTQALLAKGLAVAYISAFSAQETDDLGLRYKHDRLEQWTLADFDVAHYATRVERSLACLISVPSSQAADLAERVSTVGGSTVYDLIDDWDDPELGSDWFDSRAEHRLMEGADHLIASASDLVERIRSRAGRVAVLVPNGVNEHLFGDHGLPQPSDWPTGGDLVIGYHGSLYGSWLDWDAVRQVAATYPNALLVMIGDPKGVPDGLPRNVRLLGLKAQTDLPSYLERFDVGLLPFLINDTTHAVSPLKVYEYLASGVPVAAPPLRAVLDTAGVHVNEDLATAVAMAIDADPPNGKLAVAQHGWGSRVNVILSLLGWQPSQNEHVQVIVQKASHYSRKSRRL